MYIPVVTVGIDSSGVVTIQAGLVKSVLGASLYDGCLKGVDEAGKECTESRSDLCSVDTNFLEDWFCFGTFFLLCLKLLIDFDSSFELSIDTFSTLLYLVIFISPFFGLPKSSSEPFPSRLFHQYFCPLDTLEYLQSEQFHLSKSKPSLVPFFSSITCIFSIVSLEEIKQQKGLDYDRNIGVLNFNPMIGIIVYEKRFWTKMICQPRI
ncbi:hypothetical protein AGLY_014666 [Aphis glycines]|uniref:Uncharacterized protein n=1 Tax=Aphis glycines TaxID=307491 RepID=A0A6G0T1V1_APHGL|nr:hypothetical protein AGLY_014666 [Aphis glycines]